ncbi:hypothetical protein ACHHRT_10860 [Desulfurivibrio sp. D14AmB]|uniref:hypothetical protein n=1 Tax=Desulfurivibrio sp. D14AmB TaxID=3374370 RepID=UPI00376EAC6A
MSISIDESIRLLKAEIIAQDLQLPARRIEPLQEAVSCLKLRFKSRKNILAILGMADGVIRYIQRHQVHADLDCLDFLKEALAHVVNVYEEGKFVPEREEELGKRMYKKFANLRRIMADRREGKEPAKAPAAAKTEAPAPAPQAVAAPPRRGVAEKAPAATNNGAREYAPTANDHCLTILLGKNPLALPASAVALVEPLEPRRRGIYIASHQIPIKDFGRFLQRLAGRFKGPLAAIPSRHLKKLHLPLVMPKGGGLPLLPDEQAQHLVVLSHDQWHGVIFGTVTAEEQAIGHWQAAANGDISGQVTLDDEKAYPLLNPRSLLEREGFLIATEG